MAERIIPLQIYQKTMSMALQKLSQTDDIEEVFSDVLTVVRDYYKAGRVAIMSSLSPNSDYQSCVFEVDDEGVRTTMEAIGGPFRKHRWWYNHLEKGENIVINDVHDLPEEPGSPRELLDKLGVRSHIGIPISPYGRSVSFLSIDIIDRPFMWTDQDIRLLTDIANMIMMWRKLRTAHDEAEQENAYLHHVLSHIPVGLALYDPEGNLSYANEKVLHVFGIDKLNEVRRFNLFESLILTDEDKRMIRERDFYDSSFEYGVGNLPTKPQTFSTNILYVMARYCKLYDHNRKMKGYLVAYVDRTHETNIANRVKELDGFMSVCADFAHIGFARVNVVSGMGYGTRQWFRNFNVPNDDGMHFYSETTDRIHPKDKRKLMEFRSRAKKNPATTFRERLRVMRNDGSGQWDHVKVYSVVTRFEPEIGVVETSTISHVINRQVEMEQTLIHAKNEAEKADRLKTAFLANMSHEIRTPLNAIVGFSQLLCRGDIPESERPEVVNIIESNNTMLLQLISDILDLAKLEAGIQEFVVQDTDVNELCRSAASSIALRVKSGVDLITDTLPEECHIATDPNRLRQVLLNFANNAAKFTERGHIRIGCEHAASGRIRFFVEDTGIGIDADKKDRVFGRFVKLDDFAQGTGLGLQISMEIVKKLGGEIGVDSEKGKGSTFWCEIPLTGGNATGPAPASDEL